MSIQINIKTPKYCHKFPKTGKEARENLREVLYALETCAISALPIDGYLEQFTLTDRDGNPCGTIEFNVGGQ